jgi:purine-binding chemotaxis protein CheW
MAEHAAALRALEVPRTEPHLVFYVSEHPLAISLQHVSEILPYENVSAMPGMPVAARGVVHVRGRVLPLMDCALRLGFVPQPPTKRSCIVMLELADPSSRTPRSFGLTADRIASLLDVNMSEVQPVPDFGLQLNTRYMVGLYHTALGSVPLLSPEHLFDLRDLQRALELERAQELENAAESAEDRSND